MDERKHEFVTYCFLAQGRQHRCHGEATSNGVENVNGAPSAMRSLPIVHVMEDVLKCQQDKCHERGNLGVAWCRQGELAMHCAQAEGVRVQAKASM